MSEAQIKIKKKNDEELVNHLLKLKESSLNLTYYGINWNMRSRKHKEKWGNHFLTIEIVN